MLKLKKFSLFLAFIFVCTVFYTPNAFAEGTGANIGSLKNVKTPTSMESNMKIKLNLTSTNLSADESKTMLQLAPFLSNLVINVDMKVSSNADNTLSNAYIKAGTSIAGMPLNFEIWMKSDLTGSTPKIVEIIKMPKEIPIFPTSSGKEYMVVDTTELAATGTGTAISSFNPANMTDMTKKLTNIIYTLCDELNSKFNLVADKGSITVQTPVGEEVAHAFEIKLDDKSFKDVVQYSFNSLIQNKDFLSIITDFMKTFDTTNNTTVTDKEIADLTKGFNEFYEKFKDIKIIGDKGLIFGYALNPENYVVSQNGVIDIVIDAPSISKIVDGTATAPATAASANAPTGVYNVTLTLESINYNINKTVTIDYPVITKENSSSLTEMMTGLISNVAPKTDTKTITPVVTKPATTVKKPAVVVKKPAVTAKKTIKPVKKVVAKKTIKPTKKQIVSGTVKDGLKKIAAKKATVKKTVPVKKTTKKTTKKN